MKNLIRKILKEDDWDWAKDVNELDLSSDYTIIFRERVSEDIWYSILDYLSDIGLSINKRTWEYWDSMAEMEEDISVTGASVLFIKPEEGFSPLSYGDWDYYKGAYFTESTPLNPKKLKAGFIELELDMLLDIIKEKKQQKP